MAGLAVQLTDAPVPCVWHERPGDLVEAGLVIGAGLVDEILADYGLTHLTEHLVYGACRAMAAASNAYVSTLHTAFHARGTADDVAAFLDAVARALADLPMGGFDHEVRVLAAEARERPPGVFAELATARFGPNGPGLAAWPEYGLRRDPEALRDFAAPRFVAQRARSWICGPAPLNIELPEGVATTPDDRLVRDPSTVPAWTQCRDGVVCWSSVVDSTWATVLATSIVSERLMGRLRHEEAAVYSDSWGHERIGAGRGHVTSLIEVANARHAERTAALVVETLDVLASDGVPAEQLATHKQRRLLGFSDPAGAPGWLHWMACTAAEPGVLPMPDEQLAELRSVDVPAIRRAAQAMRQSLLLGIPTDVELRLEGLPRLGERAVQVEGQRFPGVGSHARETVVVSDEAIGISVADAPAHGVRFDSVVAGISRPGGRRLLVAGDGSWIALHPECFERAGDLTQLLLDRVPPLLRVPPSRAESRVERALERYGEYDQHRYTEVFADWLDGDEEIRATAVVYGMDGTTLVMVTDHRLLMAATGTGYGGRALRLSEITGVRWSRVLPFNVRFCAGGMDVRIDATTVDGAHEIAMLLRAGDSGERRPREVVADDARWMVAHRSRNQRLIGPYREYLKVVMIGGSSIVVIAAGVRTGIFAGVLVGLLGLFHVGRSVYRTFSRHPALPAADVNAGSDQ